MSSRHARTLLPTKKRKTRDAVVAGVSGRGEEEEETFWMK
jgi:hypothetical protein